MPRLKPTDEIENVDWTTRTMIKAKPWTAKRKCQKYIKKGIEHDYSVNFLIEFAIQQESFTKKLLMR
jgi:hypothetical protein